MTDNYSTFRQLIKCKLIRYAITWDRSTEEMQWIIIIKTCFIYFLKLILHVYFLFNQNLPHLSVNQSKPW